MNGETAMMIDTMGPVILMMVLIILIATLRHDPRAAERIEETMRETRGQRSRQSRDASRSGRRRRMSI